MGAAAGPRGWKRAEPGDGAGEGRGEAEGEISPGSGLGGRLDIADTKLVLVRCTLTGGHSFGSCL